MMLRISSSDLACHFPSRRARGPAPEWAVWAGRPGAIPSSKTRIRETGGILDTRYLPRRGGRRLVHGLPGHRGALVSEHRHLRLELPHHPHERTRQLRIELRAGPILDVRQGLRLRPRFAVGPVGAERVVHVAHVDELAPFVAVSPELERGIAIPVQHDVVLVGDHRSEIQVFLGAQDQAGALRGMLVHQARSESEKRPGLVRTSIGIFTLPISWSSPATPKARTSRADSPRDSARAIVRTATFIEWVVVY